MYADAVITSHFTSEPLFQILLAFLGTKLLQAIQTTSKNLSSAVLMVIITYGATVRIKETYNNLTSLVSK